MTKKIRKDYLITCQAQEVISIAKEVIVDLESVIETAEMIEHHNIVKRFKYFINDINRIVEAIQEPDTINDRNRELLALTIRWSLSFGINYLDTLKSNNYSYQEPELIA